MNLSLKKFVVSVSLLFFLLVPSMVHATIPPILGFGGLPVFWFPCVCSASVWNWFAPLYLTAFPITGPMVYVPYATLPLGNFLPSVPLIPELGGYIPGIQACWIYVGIACVPLPSIGVEAFVGTGL
jgi:hypothetical protein